MSRRWILASQEGFENSLQYQENVKLPSTKDLKHDEVLVRIHAASLNSREIQIADPHVRNLCCLTYISKADRITNSGHQRAHHASNRPRR